MRARVLTVGRGVLGECPAATVTDTATGDTAFLVNADVLRRMDYGQRAFILGHELGHRVLGTSDESLADAFALGLTAGRQGRSLKRALRAVASMERVPHSRLQRLYALCLKMDRGRRA